MSERRRPGEIVVRRPGSCFCGSAEPAAGFFRVTPEARAVTGTP